MSDEVVGYCVYSDGSYRDILAYNLKLHGMKLPMPLHRPVAIVLYNRDEFLARSAYHKVDPYKGCVVYVG